MAEEAEVKLKDENFNQANKGPDGPKSPIITVLLLANAILMGGVAYFQYLNHQSTSGQSNVQDIVRAELKKVSDVDDPSVISDTGEAKDEDGILFPLEGFTANLAQGDGPRRFVRLNAVLKFSKDSNEEEFKARKPQIRDGVISILNTKRPEDLLKIEGKVYLKEEIKAAINTFLVDGRVIDVYYVGFQIN
jgi:flagellar FliL protein